MSARPEQLYLELMKKTLSFALWPEPPVPFVEFRYWKPSLRRWAYTFLARILAGRNLEIYRNRNFTQAEKTEGRVWPGYADTMIGLKRLDNLQYCVETVLQDGIPGDFIETGVWRGGACIFMRAVLAAYGVNDRTVFVADSFAGLPRPDEAKYPVDKDDRHHTYDYFRVSQEEVENNFRKYGLLDDKVVFLRGWFKDTLPQAPIEQLAILRLDGDMYGSTMEALENLYPRLSAGGFCIIDDYALHGCRAAVDDYRAKHEINREMREIDWMGSYWRKQ